MLIRVFPFQIRCIHSHTFLHYKRGLLWGGVRLFEQLECILVHFSSVFYVFFYFMSISFMQAVRTFLSFDNPTDVLKWWGGFNSPTRSFMEMASFKYFVETQPTDSAKKSLLCALAERWWDTTHTFHIVGVEMMITPYDVYRLIDLRIDGAIPTFNAFPTRLRPNQKYLGVDLGATSIDLPNLLYAFVEAPQTTVEEATYMAQAFLLYLIGTTLDCNTSQTVLVRWLHLLVDFQQTA